MSTYYTYYLGYVENEQIYPLGPFDWKGQCHEIFCRSRSFASDLHEYFFSLDKLKLSNEFKKVLRSSWDADSSEEDETTFNHVLYLPVENLPSYQTWEEGYFLIEDVKYYMENGYSSFDDIFYDKMTPVEYAERLRNELKLGPPLPEKDCEGNEIKFHSCRDYMYFRYEKSFGEDVEIRDIMKMYDLLTSELNEADKVNMKFVVVLDIG